MTVGPLSIPRTAGKISFSRDRGTSHEGTRARIYLCERTVRILCRSVSCGSKNDAVSIRPRRGTTAGSSRLAIPRARHASPAPHARRWRTPPPASVSRTPPSSWGAPSSWTGSTASSTSSSPRWSRCASASAPLVARARFSGHHPSSPPLGPATEDPPVPLRRTHLPPPNTAISPDDA